MENHCQIISNANHSSVLIDTLQLFELNDLIIFFTRGISSVRTG